MTARILATVALAAIRLGAQGGAVEGKVVSVNGQPVRRANVLLTSTRVTQGPQRQAAAVYSADTDNNGNFAFSAIAAGEYRITANRPRYGLASSDQLAGTGDLASVMVTDGQRMTGVVVKLTPLGAIMGRVLDSDGDPVRAANVEALQYSYVQGKQQLQSRRNAQSNDHGEYRLFDLFPGQYLLRVLKPNQNFIAGEIRGPKPELAFAQTYFGGTTDAGRATPLDLPAGGEISGVDIQLNRQGLFSIRGHLPPGLETGPGRNVIVSAQRRQNAAGGIGFAGPTSLRILQDQYELSGLTSGSYVVTARYNDTSKPGQPMIARRSVDIVNRDEEGIDLAFSPPLEISGVMKTTGTVSIGLASQSVVLQPVEPGSPSFTGKVAADGTFTIHNIMPDAYLVHINSPGNAYPTSIKLGDQELSTRQLDLRESRGGSLTIVVSRESGRVEGTVTGDDGSPISQVNVTLVPDQSKADWSDRFRSFVTDSQGHFAFPNVIPQHYQVFAWKDAPRGAPQDPEFRKPFESAAVPIDVEVNKTLTLALKPITTQHSRQ